MNAQQIQQVRTMAQDQFQPFHQKHAERLDAIEKHIKEYKESSPTETSHLKQIIENMKEENTNLRKIISQHNEELEKMNNNISKQVNDHTKRIDESVSIKLTKCVETFNAVNNRITSIEANSSNVGIHTDVVEKAIQKHYTDKKDDIENKLHMLRTNITMSEESLEQFNKLNEEKVQISLDLQKDLTEMVKNMLQTRLDNIMNILNNMNELKINNTINKQKNEEMLLKDRLENLNKHIQNTGLW